MPLLTLLAQDWLRRVVQVKTVIRTAAQHVVATPLCDMGRLVSIRVHVAAVSRSNSPAAFQATGVAANTGGLRPGLVVAHPIVGARTALPAPGPQGAVVLFSRRCIIRGTESC